MLEEEKKEQKSMMLAMVLVVVVLMVFNHFTMKKNTQPLPTATEEVVQVEENTLSNTKEDSKITSNSKMDSEVASTIVSTGLVGSQKALSFQNDFISGSFITNGTTFDALELTQYKETTKKDSPSVFLLDANYKTRLNWDGVDFPNTQDLPKITGDNLTPQTPVILEWANNKVSIKRTISIDNSYMITFEDKVTNKTLDTLKASLKGEIIRDKDSIVDNRSTVHEGFLGLFDNKEKENRYAEIKEDKSFLVENRGGWIGMTDKYWQTIFIPDQSMTSQMKFEKNDSNYISSFETPFTIAPGDTVIRSTKLFAGAKELKVINDYVDQGIPRFDLSIDFGWYYFLTKPFLYFLGWLYSLIGNMGVVILIFATLIRIALLPIATKSYESMAKMKKIQPKIKAIQERFKDNRAQLQIEMMNLYKRDKVNPASGCLPMLIQIPVFFALYKVLSVSILMRQAPFFGWITDLSQPDPASIFTAFGYLPWPIPSFLNIGVWPVLMGLTMVIQQRLNPAVSTSKDQQMMMNLMPIIFTFMLGNFASGLVIYWTWSNILSIAQQKYIMKKVGV